ncbi:MAG: polyribonucleotide nucleotidyltransferase [Sedimentisphaerales bacterium]|nr:polyribonucleotide nucleotidyltransferase [Sedimentisphaerales bacterium]
MIKKVERQIAGRLLSIETGKLAKQASGAVTIRYGDTVVLATAVSSQPREGIDFFPLQVDYREKTSAAGKFPGGFIKREGRPTTKEILTMRMIDRPLRPLFPKGFRDEVQIMTMVLSADQQNEPDILAMIGASAALCLSDIPFDGPTSAVRIGRINDQFVINPTHDEMKISTLELVLSGHKHAVNMIEVQARELPEEVIADAIEFGYKTIVEICDMIAELTTESGKEKYPFEIPDTDELVGMMEQKFTGDYIAARQINLKQQRENRFKELFEGFCAEVCPEGMENPPYTPELLRMAFEDFQEKVMRREILEGRRAGGRPFDELRPISGEVNVLPRTHGSAIFTRGETQSLVTATLGTTRDEQIIDGLKDEYSQKFMLHYNFPPFCVGETGRIAGPGRREIGHGALAEKSLAPVLPDIETFPYTIRLVSDILESNGSSSMASTCGGTLALMDAGVPIIRPVAGISIGMVSEGDRYVLLTDILGEEDHFGDMDFKVCGTQKGVTGIQLDLKKRGLEMSIIRESFTRARDARIKILQNMLSVISEPRPNISVYAPKLITIKIPVDMIGKVIGPGGRDIKAIQEKTGTVIEIEDDGTVFISCLGGDNHLRAKEIIELMVEPVKVGKVYTGRVVAVKDFGAFIEIAPGQEGLCHISELANRYVASVSDVCKVGDEMPVKVIAVDEQGRIKLSHKQTDAAREKQSAGGAPAQ